MGVQMTDSDRWDFVMGNLPFQRPVVFDEGARRVPDRFTHEHLKESAANFGLRPYDEVFLAPDHEAILIDHLDPPNANQRTLTLAQARGEEPYDRSQPADPRPDASPPSAFLKSLFSKRRR